MIFETARLILREWRESDIAPFARMCADAEVMAYFEHRLDPDATAALVHRLQERWARDGFGMWALELPGQAAFIGFTGIQRVPFEVAFTPAVEIGWRLAREAWGQGYATEAARAALADGFGRCGLDEIVAMAVPANRPSVAVMERIGMRRDPDGDFDHPGVSTGHKLQRHLLYRITASAFRG